MDILDLIKNIDPIDEVINVVKTSDLPTILYGVSQAGSLTYDFLSKHNILVDEVAIDEEYFHKCDQKVFKDNKIRTIEYITEKYNSPINLFIGFYVNELPKFVNKKIEYSII